MADDVAHYPRYRFPPAIISHAVWLYYRFTTSFATCSALDDIAFGPAISDCCARARS